METLLGRTVRINRGGPESRTGLLLAVKPDHVVLQSEEGVVYFTTAHIKSLTADSKEYPGQTSQNSEGNELQQQTYFDVDSFDKVMQNMQYAWVQINRGGPERLEGVLSDVEGEIATLVTHHEVITIFRSHMRSISYGKNKENQDKKENQQNKENNKSEDQEKKEEKKA